MSWSIGSLSGFQGFTTQIYHKNHNLTDTKTCSDTVGNHSVKMGEKSKHLKRECSKHAKVF